MKPVNKRLYIKEFPKPLLDAMVRGDVVPFIGAGFSKNCNGPEGFTMPDWKQLGELIAKELPDFEYLGNPLEALSAYEFKYKRIPLVEFMRRIFRINEIQPGDAHKLLATCFGGIICTTNFDTLIEDAFKSLLRGCIPVTSEDGLAIANSEDATIVKAHGDFNHPNRMVVTEDDYDMFIENNPLLCTYISNLFITKTMLLIGYSLDDSDLRQMLKVVQCRLGKMSRPVYCIQVGADNRIIDRFRRRGVDVINIPCSKHKSYTQIITDVLRELRNYIDQEAQRLVSSSIVESKERLLLSSEDNKLCFVDCATNRIAALKEMLNPVILRAGAVPMWPDNIIANGMEIRSAVEAAIRKANVRIFDVSEVNKSLVYELMVANRSNHGRTILIEDDLGSRELKGDIQNYIRLQYSMKEKPNVDDFSPNDLFLQKLEDAISACIRRNAEEELLRKARKLYEQGDYGTAVVSAWIEIEATLAKYRRGVEPASIWQTIKSYYPKDGHADIVRMRELRNEVVHAIRRATKRDADFALEFARKVISQCNNIINGN